MTWLELRLNSKPFSVGVLLSAALHGLTGGLLFQFKNHLQQSNQPHSLNRGDSLISFDLHTQRKIHDPSNAIASRSITPKSESPPALALAPKTGDSTDQSVTGANSDSQDPVPLSGIHLSIPYPVLSRKLGEQGNVQIRVWISKLGSVQRVQLMNSSGFPRLDNAAIKALANAELGILSLKETTVRSITVAFALKDND